MGSQTQPTEANMKTTLLPLLVLVLASLTQAENEKSPSPQRLRQHFRPIISQLSPATQDKVLIARADSEPGVEPRQTLAKVIQHNNKDSPYARTVVIQNTQQAFQAFGVKNIPQHILRSWARNKRRTQNSQSQPSNLEDLEDLEDQVFN